VGVAPATAAAAAAAAAAAMAGSPKSSNSNTWRPFGTSASAPVTPLSGAVGLLTPEPAAAGDPKKPGPWVPAHRLAHMANSSGAVSDAEVGSSSSGGALMGSLGRPPRHRRSSGVESDGYARSDGGDSSDGGMGGVRRSLAHRSGRSLQSTIEAIREASCELDPAVAAKAIATLSGTASAAAAADDAGEEGGSSRRRQRRRSSSTARAAAAAASVAMGSTSGEQGSAAGAVGGSGEVEPQQRSGRQRRRSTGSRRQSLDLQVGTTGRVGCGFRCCCTPSLVAALLRTRVGWWHRCLPEDQLRGDVANSKTELGSASTGECVPGSNPPWFRATYTGGMHYAAGHSGSLLVLTLALPSVWVLAVCRAPPTVLALPAQRMERSMAAARGAVLVAAAAVAVKTASTRGSRRRTMLPGQQLLWSLGRRPAARLLGVAAAAAGPRAAVATGLASARCVQHMLVRRTQSRMLALPVALMARVGSAWGGAAPWLAHHRSEACCCSCGLVVLVVCVFVSIDWHDRRRCRCLNRLHATVR
jgi:hypothetical protein